MTPKFILRINGKTLKYDTFFYNEPGPVPPIVDPEEPETPKDTLPERLRSYPKRIRKKRPRPS